MHRDKLREILLNGLFRDKLTMSNAGFKGVQDDLTQEPTPSFYNSNEPSGFVVYTNENDRFLVTIQKL